jgi:phosphoadenosine phosphosulfate reductase
MTNLDQIKERLTGKDTLEILDWIGSEFGSGACFSSSLGLEDQVITHMIFSNNLPIEIFTIDTGRLFAETQAVLRDTMKRYGKAIRVYEPELKAVESMISQKGLNSFYESVENRIECCTVRKVVPLKKALTGKNVWITGIRSEQSENRKDMPMVEWDEINTIIKIHPLLNWTMPDIRDFLIKNDVPFNPLHDRGYVSIGCEPCTRAVKDGEDARAGRWWWENNSKKECGLHPMKR